jgi:carbon-monoxide dehydrogenase large subunit
VPLQWISVQLGDTATATYSNFSSQASRSLTLAGAALIRASDKLRGRILALAAAALGTDPTAVEQDGAIFRAGASQITWREIAHRGWMGWGRDDPGVVQLEETADFDPPGIPFSYAVQAASVAVDIDTGKVAVEEYWSVNDSGVLVNPMIAEGQIVGGIAQGLGIALLEEAVYDPSSGQPLCTTYLDYAVPLAEDVPDVKVEHMCSPSPLVPGGFKGLGEGGIMPPPATIGNAIADAVPEIAGELLATPLSPGRVWEMLHNRGLTELPVAEREAATVA